MFQLKWFDRPKQEALSLRDWFFISILSLSFSGFVFIFILVKPEPSEAFANHNSERFKKLNSKEINIVLLGDSRMRYAINSELELSERLEERLGRKINVLKIVNNWAVFDDFSPLVTNILDLSPELVVLQNELFSKTRSQYAVKVLSRQYWVWKLFGHGDWDPSGLDQALLQNEMRCSVLDKQESVAGRKSRANKWFDFSASGASQFKLERFIEQLSKNDIPYTSLIIPITSRAKEGLPSPTVDVKTKYSLLKPNIVIDDQNFCDLVHMDPVGREVFSQWFVESVITILESP